METTKKERPKSCSELELHFRDCLFFSAARFGRVLNEIADRSFRPLGLAPTYAFILICISMRDQIQPSELAQILRLKQSTVTRLIDKLVEEELVARTSVGRRVELSMLPPGRERLPKAEACWQTLRHRMDQAFSKPKTSFLAGELFEVLSKNPSVKA